MPRILHWEQGVWLLVVVEVGKWQTALGKMERTCMVALGSWVLYKSQQMLRAAHWGHVGKIILLTLLNWKLWGKQRNKITPGLSLLLRTVGVNVQHVLFHPTGKPILFLLGKVFIFSHLWNHVLQGFGGHRARRHLRSHLALLLTVSVPSHITWPGY